MLDPAEVEEMLHSEYPGREIVPLYDSTQQSHELTEENTEWYMRWLGATHPLLMEMN